jgi:hypothetical protein
VDSGLFIKITIFCVVATCWLAWVYRRFRGPGCHHHQGEEWLIVLMMEAVRTSETSVNLYQSIWRYNPEHSHHHTHRRENLKLYLAFLLLRHGDASLWNYSLHRTDCPSPRRYMNECGTAVEWYWYRKTEGLRHKLLLVILHTPQIRKVLWKNPGLHGEIAAANCLCYGTDI